MNRSQKSALVLDLARKLRARGSWCGETHLQKSLYFLQAATKVPLEFAFVLYKYGPFSFDLRAELTALRADGLLDLRPQSAPYGPSLVPTAVAETYLGRYPQTLATYQPQLDFVAERLGKKGVAELERLATALYVIGELGAGSSPIDQASRITALKPHVSLGEAEAALEEAKQILAEAPAAPA